MFQRAFNVGTIRVVDITCSTARVHGVNSQPLDRVPEHRHLVAFAPGTTAGFHGIGVANEDQLAIDIEPPVGACQFEGFKFKSGAAFIAGPGRKPRRKYWLALPLPEC